MKVFWSWQSDTPGKTGRHFIRDALNAAVDYLKQTKEIEEPSDGETRLALHIDHDRKGVPGSPELARIIFEKIDNAAVFVVDVTPVGIIAANEKQNPPKKVINGNVAIELGYALHALTDQAILMIMNEHYGGREDLPFDLKTKAGPITFDLAPDADKRLIETAHKQLTARFVEALEPFVAKRIENVRRANPFTETDAKDGPARFRAPGEPLGYSSTLTHIGHTSGQAVRLIDGPVTWLRLMPRIDEKKTWAANDLQDAARRGPILLQPFIWSNLGSLRAEDGFGQFASTGLDHPETTSVAFAFETGEVWAIDTWALGINFQDLFIFEIERGWTERLKDYGQFLGRLGLCPPYRWIAGIVGAKHRRLQYPSPPGKNRLPGWRGPECLSDEIVAEGPYDGEQSEISALLPFFELIYKKCGITRPDYLPR